MFLNIIFWRDIQKYRCTFAAQIHTLGKSSTFDFNRKRGNAFYGVGIGNNHNQYNALRMDLHRKAERLNHLKKSALISALCLIVILAYIYNIYYGDYGVRNGATKILYIFVLDICQ